MNRRTRTSGQTVNVPPDFDSRIYLELNPDVAGSGMSAVEHYVKFGLAEGRRTHHAQMTPSVDSERERRFLASLARLRPDLPVEDIERLLIDRRSYLSIRPDVRKAGASPLSHFLNHGARENTAPAMTLQPIGRRGIRSATRYDSIYWFNGPAENASYLYRCVFPAGFDNSSKAFCAENRFHDVIEAIFDTRTVVFLRPTVDSTTIYLMTLCRNLGVEIIADYDDLLLPEFTRTKGAFRSGMIDFKPTVDALASASASVLWADRITCSTEAIADAMSASCSNIEVKPNRLPTNFFNKAGTVTTRRPSDSLQLLYSSGTNTHVRDFAVAAGSLLKFVQSNPGLVDLSFLGQTASAMRAFAPYCRSTRLVGMLPFNDMLREISRHDALLVPLEQSHFNDSKSNIKFIEAASQGVPIVASAVAEFKKVIISGDNGVLCANQADWHRSLELLKSNRDTFRLMGASAYRQAWTDYRLP